MIRRITKFTIIAAILSFALWAFVESKEAGIEVSHTEVSKPSAARLLTVTIASDDTITIDGQATEGEDVVRRFEEVVGESTGKMSVVIEAHEDSDPTMLVLTLDAARKAGVEDVAIAAP